MTEQQTNKSLERLELLVKDCRKQTAFYLQSLSFDTASCFEICRRAIAELNDDAWTAFYEIYTPFVRQWIKKQTRGWETGSLEEEDLIQEVLYRVVRNIKPERFAGFDSLAKLLEYIKLCCRTVVINTTRRKKEITISEDLSEADTNVSPLVDFSEHDKLIKLIFKVLKNEDERLAIMAFCFEGLAPREIAQVYAHYFTDIQAVRNALRNAKYKLKRNKAFVEWLADYQN